MYYCHYQGESGFLPSNGSECMIGNVGRKGFYRVNYDMQCWDEIVNLLIRSPDSLSVNDRAGTLDDAFTLARYKND